MASVAIIGGGLAGVGAGRALTRDGFDVTVFDKGRRPGGRCSSKPAPLHFDYGAQYVTATDPRFVATLADLEARGVIAEWRGRFVEFAGGHATPQTAPTRYVAVPSMNRLVRTLAAPLALLTRTRIARATESARGWRLGDADGSDLGEYDALLLAMPPEQARALVPRGTAIHARLCEFRSVPCWAAMLSSEAPLPLDFDGASFCHDVVLWAARDSGKPGREAGERWVVHATASWSRDRFSEDPAVVAAELAEAFCAITAIGQPEFAAVNAHRWGLARVDHGPRPVSLWDEDMRLGVCGDWCVAPNLEGAWLSGLDAAARLSASIGLRRAARATSLTDKPMLSA